MLIRAMEDADAPAVARLSEQLGYPTTPAKIAERLALIGSLPDNALFVAEDDSGAVVGWGHVCGVHLLESTNSYAEIGGLVVDERMRRSGVGLALIQAIEDWAVKHGYGDVCVRSSTVRTGAHAFYQRLGYDLVKMQHCFRKPLRL